MTARRYSPPSRQNKKAALCVVASVAFVGVVLCLVFVGAMTLLLWDEGLVETFEDFRREMQGGSWF